MRDAPWSSWDPSPERFGTCMKVSKWVLEAFLSIASTSVFPETIEPHPELPEAELLWGMHL
jgi:hypothetical protein